MFVEVTGCLPKHTVNYIMECNYQRVIRGFMLTFTTESIKGDTVYICLRLASIDVDRAYA